MDVGLLLHVRDKPQPVGAGSLPAVRVGMDGADSVGMSLTIPFLVIEQPSLLTALLTAYLTAMPYPCKQLAPSATPHLPDAV